MKPIQKKKIDIDKNDKKLAPIGNLQIKYMLFQIIFFIF